MVKEKDLEITIGDTTDYIYCEDCHEFVNLLRYGTFEQDQFRVEGSGHADHNWRYITDKELNESADLPIFVILTRDETCLLELAMRLLRWNSLESYNEYKKYIPIADSLISRLRGCFGVNYADR